MCVDPWYLSVPDCSVSLGHLNTTSDTPISSRQKPAQHFVWLHTYIQKALLYFRCLSTWEKRLGELESFNVIFLWQALQLPTSLRIWTIPELSFTDLSAAAKPVLNMMFLILGRNRLGNELCACAASHPADGQPVSVGSSHAKNTAKRQLPVVYFCSNIMFWN